MWKADKWKRFKGNGGIYYYYHCQSVKQCKERFRADIANEAFVRQLSEIAINAPIIDYYCQLISNSLKNDKQGEEKELKEIQSEIDKLYIRIQNARSMRLDEEFTAEEFKEMKIGLLKKIEELEKRKTKLLSTTDEHQEYLSHGGEIIRNIANRYIAASPIGKKQIIGSIFAAKLIFSINIEPQNLMSSLS